MSTPPPSKHTPAPASKDAPTSVHTGKSVKYWPRLGESGKKEPYVALPQTTAFALAKARLSGPALSLALALATVIYQFNEHRAVPKPASYDDLRDQTDLHRQQVRDGLATLEERWIINVERGVGKKRSTYSFRPVSEWMPAPESKQRGGKLKQRIVNPSDGQPSSPVDRTTSGPMDRITEQSDGSDYIGPVNRTATNTHKQFFKQSVKHEAENSLCQVDIGAPETRPILVDDNPELVHDNQHEDGAEDQPTGPFTAPKPLLIERPEPTPLLSVSAAQPPKSGSQLMREYRMRMAAERAQGAA
jgi:hypothetical protein